MSDTCATEIRKAIEDAARTGELLRVATAAKRIAGLCGASPKFVADGLTEAGIRAGLTMQFGTPE
jgi:hypothetical protein